jgi:20S proteasome alpha/beta subunit
MTTCIGAICECGRTLILCSDQKVSYNDFASDEALLKIRSIHKHWAIMCSAEDFTYFKPILLRVREKITDREAPLAFSNVQDFVSQSIYEEFCKERDGLLGLYDMTIAEFKKEGRNIFGESIFAQKCEEIERISLGGCELLVAGFDENGGGHIFTAQSPGKLKIHDDLGYWAIGSGQTRALSTLAFHRFNIWKSLEEGLYHVCEAKFMSEDAEGVGEKTSFLSCRRSADGRTVDVNEIQKEDIEKIRGQWNGSGKPRVPTKVKVVIQSALKSAKRMIFG